MTTFVTTAKTIKRDWHLVDAKAQVLGRIATKIATLLQGKNKVYYTPQLDCGDYVVVINSDQIVVTGKKALNKKYYSHSNYPGGFKTVPYADQMAKDSRRIIIRALTNMLPKNKLRQGRLNRLKVFKDDQHIYQDKLQPKADTNKK